MNEALRILRQWLVQKKFQGVVLAHEASVSWLLGGRYHIAIATEMACVAVLITPDSMEVLVNNIEAQRLQDEEGLVADKVHIHDWFDDDARTSQLASWLRVPGIVEESAFRVEIQSLRLRLEGPRIDEVRDLGRLIGEALYQTCVSLHPTQTEYEVAGMLSQQCLSRGVEPIVNLVAGTRRAHLYRHVMPTAEQLGQYAVISVSGRRKGLVLSATRMVHFGPTESQIAHKYHAVLQVEAALLHATQAGGTLGAAFLAGVSEYQRQGYQDEWKLHHQGGIAGYLSREVRAMSDHPMILEPNMLVAWNPTIRGVKAEDTVLLKDQGVEILTLHHDFPTETVDCGNDSFQLPSMMQL